MAPQKLLILGGTSEAVTLARALAPDPRLSIVTSLAGRTRRPSPMPGEVRVGGFGGVDGLARYIRRRGVRLVIDATHPYAAVISEHAAEACRRSGVDRLQLLRPPWPRRADDDWISVACARASAGKLEPGQRVFLTTGRRDLAVYAAVDDAWFLVRLVEPVEPSRLPPRSEVQLARGPFDVASELRLMRQHRIDTLVAKNSGGGATYAKIEAARRLRMPVLMIERPPAPTGPRVASAEDVLAWVERRIRAPSTR